MNSLLRTLSLALAGLALAGAAHAADPYKPSDKQLKALCDGCGIVTAVNTERRKGKGSGVGAVGGAVAGGVVGNKVGDSTTATVGGAVVGGLLGNEIEKRVKRHTVWVVTTTQRDGTSQRHEMERDPQLKAGDLVAPDGANGLKKR